MELQNICTHEKSLALLSSCVYQKKLTKELGLRKRRRRKSVFPLTQRNEQRDERFEEENQTQVEQKKNSISRWEEAAKLSELRSDSFHLCSICQQHFGLRPQVLLSCSHVFHKACLQSFEKFLDNLRHRKCPLCREANYDKKNYDGGKKAYKIMCSVKLQSFWRMVQCSKKFETSLAEHYKTKNCDSRLRRRFLLKHLNHANREVKASLETRARRIDDVLAACESSLALSKSVFMKLDGESELSQWMWRDSKRKALQRESLCCCICLEEAATNREKESLMLLPCSHVFHEPCFNSFEAFHIQLAITKSSSYAKQATATNFFCPLCRGSYSGEKRRLGDVDNLY